MLFCHYMSMMMLMMMMMMLMLSFRELEANWHWTNPNEEVFQLAAERGK